jgi:hypothetical protein
VELWNVQVSYLRAEDEAANHDDEAAEQHLADGQFWEPEPEVGTKDGSLSQCTAGFQARPCGWGMLAPLNAIA